MHFYLAPWNPIKLGTHEYILLDWWSSVHLVSEKLADYLQIRFGLFFSSLIISKLHFLYTLYSAHIVAGRSCFSLFIWDLGKVQIGFLLLAPSFLLALPNELTDIASSSLFLDIVYLRILSLSLDRATRLINFHPLRLK